MNTWEIFGLLLIALSLGLFVGHILGQKISDGFDISDIENAYSEGFEHGYAETGDGMSPDDIRWRAAAWVKQWWRVQT
jgi:hypothetical protein